MIMHVGYSYHSLNTVVSCLSLSLFGDIVLKLELVATMKTLTSHTLVAVTLAKGIRAFSVFPCSGLKTHTTPLTVINCPIRRNTHSRKLGTARYMSTGNSVTIKQIDKRALHEIIEDIESTSREESGYVVIGE